MKREEEEEGQRQLENVLSLISNVGELYKWGAIRVPAGLKFHFQSVVIDLNLVTPFDT